MSTQVLVYHGKHGNEIFGAEGDALYDASLRLLQELKDGRCYDDEVEERAEAILNEGDGKAAYDFLKKRSDEGCEYERISLEQMR